MGSGGMYVRQRYLVVGKRKSVWLLLGALVYAAVVLLGLGNMVVSLVSISDKELPVYSVQRSGLSNIPIRCGRSQRPGMKSETIPIPMWIL